MRKILSLLLILALVMTSFIACGKNEEAKEEEKKELTAQELYDKVSDESEDMTNLSFAADFELEVSGFELMNLDGPMTLNITGDMKDQETMKMSINVDTGQGVIQSDIYFKDQVMLLNVPFVQALIGYQYIQLDMNEASEQAGIDATSFTSIDQEKLKDIMKKFEKQSKYSMEDLYDLDEAIEETEVTVNEEEVDVKKISAAITLDDIDGFAMAFIKFVLEDEDAKSLFLNEVSESDLAVLKDSINSGELEAEMKSALEKINFNSLDMVMYVDEDYHAVKTEIVADMTFEDEMQSVSVKLTGHIDAFNIGKVKDIEVPDVAPEQIYNLTDMY